MPLLPKFLRSPKPAKANPFTPARTPLPYSFYCLYDWQRSPTHTEWARAQFKEPIFRDLLALIYNARPVALNQSPTDGVAAAYELGLRAGYDQLFSQILALPRAVTPPTPEVELDYGAPNAEELDSFLT